MRFTPHGLFGCMTFVARLAIAAPLAAQDDGKDKMKHDSMMGHENKMMMEMGTHGAFTGANGHKTGGSYEIATAEGKQWLKLGEDFSLDNAPDAYVVISPSDKGGDRKAINLGKLKSFKGAQAYEIKAGTDLAGFNHVIIYCKKYDVTLGSAELAAPGEMMHK